MLQVGPLLAIYPASIIRVLVHIDQSNGRNLMTHIAFLPAARYEHAGLHLHFVLLPSFLPVKRLQEAFRGQKSTGTWVIEATDLM